MEGAEFRGKSLAATARDIADGYLSINPLILKKLMPEDYKSLYHYLRKIQTEVRSEKFPLHDTLSIRSRNMRLHRLHNAIIILQHIARERKVILA
ncbi:MAG: hypothetical protein AABY39_10545 [Nitrospirota bacterium]